MDKGNQRVAVYCRLARKSSHEMKEQKKELCHYAESLGYGGLVFYADNGFSGTAPDRPAFSKLNKAIQGGQVDTVIVRDISRIGRNYLLVLNWIDEVKKQGVTLKSMDGSLENHLHFDFAKQPR